MINELKNSNSTFIIIFKLSLGGLILGTIIDYLTQYDNAFTIATSLYTSFSIIIIIAKKLREYKRIHSIEKLLGGRKVHIHIPTRGSQLGNETRIKPLVAMEDYSSAEHLRAILCNYGIVADIVYIPEDGIIDLDQDSINIVICGPKNSPYIDNYFKSLSENYNFHFQKDEEGWYFEMNGSRYYSPLEDRHNQYAFLGKTDNFLLFCGIHAIGSDGVTHFLRKTSNIDTILKQSNKNGFYSLIKSAYSAEGKVISSQLIDIKEVTE